MNDVRPSKEGIIGAGIDAPKERRPGVPMETQPHAAAGVHWDQPPRQELTGEILKRPDLKRLTATFGTAQPPHGLSGALRRYAYTIPDHRPRHWAVLLLADRVDVVESAVTDAVRLRPVASAAVGALFCLGIATIFGMRTKRWRRRRLSALPRFSRSWF